VPTLTSSSRRGRLAGIEGLRALAAGTIVVYHAWLYSAPDGVPVELGYLSRFVLPHLASGVTLFFALSGFLLYRPLAAAVLNGMDRSPTRSYLRNRALRILPAYWLILCVTGLVMGAVQIRSGRNQVALGSFLEAPGQFLRNAFFMQNYSSSSLDSGIGPAWSLSVEVAFYLMLPLLGWIAIRTAAGSANHKRRVLASLTAPALALAVGWVTAALVESGRLAGAAGEAIVARSFLNHADLFALGMVLAVLHVLIERGDVRLPQLWRSAAFVGLATVAAGTSLLVDRGVILRYQGAPVYEGLTSIACALLLAVVVLPGERSGAPVTVRLLEWRPFAAAGLAAYSLFLWHEPVVRWLTSHGLTHAGSFGFLLNLSLIAVVAGVLSAVTYWMVERPALARKASQARRPPIALNRY
jgi:peptidoglycan/LPS O-acetylase OafA/YrhL